MRLFVFAPLALMGCMSDSDVLSPDGPIAPELAPVDCADATYSAEAPDDPAEMEIGGVLFPYRWPEAISMSTGAQVELDLGDVPCDLSPDIDWSPFDMLLFVSVPAW